jgi:hypothetical protein
MKKRKVSLWRVIVGALVGFGGQANIRGLSFQHFGSPQEAQAFAVASMVMVLVGIYLLISGITGFRLIKSQATSSGNPVGKCPKCHLVVTDDYSKTWCLRCREPLPPDIIARLSTNRLPPQNNG